MPGSKKGSGYGGMRFAVCPRCRTRLKKSYRQIAEGRLACLNVSKCDARRAKKEVR